MKEAVGESADEELTAALVGLGVGIWGGAAWGAVNGWLIALRQAAPVVVDARQPRRRAGRGALLSGGSNVSGTPPADPGRGRPGTVLGVPVPFVIAAVVVLACGLLLARTAPSASTTT